MKINLFLIGKRNIVLIGLLLLGSFCFAQNPIINSIIPTAAKPGDTIQIVGDYFSTSTDSNKVFFGIVPGTVVSATTTKLSIVVPISASQAPISVTVRGKTTMSNSSFKPKFASKKYPLDPKSFSSKQIFLKPMNEYLAYPGRNINIVRSHDLNGDGKPELITSLGDSSRVTILKNASVNGDLKFSDTITLSIGLSLSDVQIADIDGDGKPDIVASNNNHNTITILRNTSIQSSISFEQKKTFSIPVLPGPEVWYKHPIFVRMADFNKDGLLDIFTISGSDIFGYVFINNSQVSNISFVTNPIGYMLYTRSIQVNDVIISDINGDSDLELIIVSNKTLPIFQIKKDSIGMLSFTKVFEVNIPTSIDAFSFNNFDHDEKPDLLITTPSPNKLSLFSNRSTVDKISFVLSSSDTLPVGGGAYISSDDLSGDTKNDAFITISTSPFGFSVVSDYYQDTIIDLSKKFITTARNTLYQLSPVNRFVDLNNDGKQDIVGLAFRFEGMYITVIKNEHETFPIIKSFSPISTSYGDTINIKGYNFSGVTSVKFKDSAAASYVIVSDTLIKAVVGKSESGYISVSSSYGTDTLGGFIFNHPTITFSPSPSLTFPAIKGKTSKAHPYTVKAKNLQGSIQITAPRFFEVSHSADSGFSQTTTLQPILGKIDSANIYVRFKTDSSVTAYSDSMQHSTPGLAVTKYALSVNICDSIILFKPYINNISKDSTIFCFKQDTLTLSVTNGSNFNVYKWSTGDTVSVSRIANSQNASIRVGSSIACLSEPSPIVRFVKNTNTTPSIGLTNDSILVSTNAPFYKWYFNNRLMGDSSSSITAKKVGFYKVETSNDKLCWDASTSYPIISLPNLASTDTVRIRIFPNPVSGGFFNVVASLDRVTNVIARVTVTDASGLILVQTNKFIFFGREIKIPITLSTYKGTAFVRVEINGDVETKTIILQ